MGFAIIIRGPAGTGKSEISNHLKKDIPNIIHLDIDKFKHIISKNSSNVRSAIAHNVGSFFLKQLMENNFNIVVEEIFREEYYNEIIKILEEGDYKIIKVFLTASKEMLLMRDRERAKNKGEEIIVKLEQEIKPLNEDLIIDTGEKTIEEIKYIILKKLNTDGLL
ncbi:MAG: zeta toxin family protein [Candidatus Woesearchaeota archaeon]